MLLQSSWVGKTLNGQAYESPTECHELRTNESLILTLYPYPFWGRLSYRVPHK